MLNLDIEALSDLYADCVGECWANIREYALLLENESNRFLDRHWQLSREAAVDLLALCMKGEGSADDIENIIGFFDNTDERIQDRYQAECMQRGARYFELLAEQRGENPEDVRAARDPDLFSWQLRQAMLVGHAITSIGDYVSMSANIRALPE